MKTMPCADSTNNQCAQVFVAFALATFVVVASQLAEMRYGLNIWAKDFYGMASSEFGQAKSLSGISWRMTRCVITGLLG